MEIDEAIEIIRAYNAWRRGADVPHPAPDRTGVALDMICDYAESQMSRDLPHY